MCAAEDKARIERLHAAFGERDGAAMRTCHAPDAHFRDPAFGDLHGADVGAMWRMLVGRASDLEIELREHETDAAGGSAHWIARYTFSTGRPVLNDIRAAFRFTPEVLIADPVDEFDFRAWARQALGPSGNLVALLPPLRRKARAKALEQLAAFKREESASGAAETGVNLEQREEPGSKVAVRSATSGRSSRPVRRRRQKRRGAMPAVSG